MEKHIMADITVPATECVAKPEGLASLQSPAIIPLILGCRRVDTADDTYQLVHFEDFREARSMSIYEEKCIAEFRAKYEPVVDDKAFVLIERARSICTPVLGADAPRMDGIVAVEGVVSMLGDAMDACRDRLSPKLESSPEVLEARHG